MSHSRRLITTLAALGLLAGMSGCIQEQNLPDPSVQAETGTPATEFRNWAKGDSHVDEYDFAKAVDTLRIFEMWDADGNGVVDEDEFLRTSFRVWDIDDSGDVDPEEFATSSGSFFTSRQPSEEFGQWDLDRDDSLVIYELQKGFERTNLFRYWDDNNDGLVNRDEFVGGAYAAWDTSDNGMIEQGEWERAVERWIARFRRGPGV